eukprot:TRINITY_DN43765_c0_g1_i1.p1 TRINITY_DN43765_c0_g1~~TRINITY_DN43765_c0_g1_i1.p1  ORF type:complete len:376 (-),score=45.68 TRINITY_DN43765_c0_g1_i1:127-1254(-)
MAVNFPPVESPIVIHVALQYSDINTTIRMAAWTAQKGRIALEVLDALDMIVEDYPKDISLFDETRTKGSMRLLRTALDADHGAESVTGSTSTFSDVPELANGQASSNTQIQRPPAQRPASATVSLSPHQSCLQALRLSRLRPASVQQLRQPVSQPRETPQSATSREHVLQPLRTSNATNSVSRGQSAARYVGRLPYCTQSQSELPVFARSSGELPLLNAKVAASGQSSSGRAQASTTRCSQTARQIVQGASIPAQSTYSHRHPALGGFNTALGSVRANGAVRKSFPAAQQQGNSSYAAFYTPSEDELLVQPPDWKHDQVPGDSSEVSVSHSFDSNESVYGGSASGRAGTKPAHRLGTVREIPFKIRVDGSAHTHR